MVMVAFHTQAHTHAQKMKPKRSSNKKRNKEKNPLLFGARQYCRMLLFKVIWRCSDDTVGAHIRATADICAGQGLPVAGTPAKHAACPTATAHKFKYTLRSRRKTKPIDQKIFVAIQYPALTVTMRLWNNGLWLKRTPPNSSLIVGSSDVLSESILAGWKMAGLGRPCSKHFIPVEKTYV